MKALLAAALLLTSILAGCSSGDKDPDASGGSQTAPVLFLNVTVDGETHRYTSASGPAAGSTSASTSATGSVSASATLTGSNSTVSGGAGGNATKPTGTGSGKTPSGDAPLNVSVTLGGSGLPSAYTWTLDWGDSKGAGSGGLNVTLSATSSATSASGSANATGTAGAGGSANGTRGAETGSKLPATLRHTYTAAGNHTIRLTLAPKDGAPVDVRATVRVAGAGGNGTGNGTATLPPGSDLGTSTLDQEGALLLGAYDPDLNCGGGVEGSATFEWVINATGPDGATPAAVASFLVTLTPDDPSGAQDADLFLLGPDGSEIGSGTGTTATETIEESDGYPAGTYQVVVLGCIAVDLPFTVHGEAKLVAA